MNKRNVVLSFAAGLLGGAISHYLSPQLVHAQSQAPKELRAESFVLVNEKGIVLGTLSDDGGRPSLKLLMNVAGRSRALAVRSEFARPPLDGKILPPESITPVGRRGANLTLDLCRVLRLSDRLRPGFYLPSRGPIAEHYRMNSTAVR
jgi:hypothetical protein